MLQQPFWVTFKSGFFCCFANAFWTSDKWIIFYYYFQLLLFIIFMAIVLQVVGPRWPFFLFRIFYFIVFNSELFQPRINCDGQFFLAPNRMEKWNDFDMKQMLKYIHWKVPLYLDEKLSISPSMWYWKREWRSTLSIQPCIEGKNYQGFLETKKSHWFVIQKRISAVRIFNWASSVMNKNPRLEYLSKMKDRVLEARYYFI